MKQDPLLTPTSTYIPVYRPLRATKRPRPSLGQAFSRMQLRDPDADLDDLTDEALSFKFRVPFFFFFFLGGGGRMREKGAPSRED